MSPIISAKKIAFVLSGGGARGALQVGAIRALLEAGIYPDLLVGSSVGAANATFLAIKGVSLGSVQSLAQVWLDAARKDLLTSNLLRLTLSKLLHIHTDSTYRNLRTFLPRMGWISRCNSRISTPSK